MQECSPKHSHMGTARMKQENEKTGEGKKRGMSVARSKERTPDGLFLVSFRDCA